MRQYLICPLELRIQICKLAPTQAYRCVLWARKDSPCWPVLDSFLPWSCQNAGTERAACGAQQPAGAKSFPHTPKSSAGLADSASPDSGGPWLPSSTPSSPWLLIRHLGPEETVGGGGGRGDISCVSLWVAKRQWFGNPHVRTHVAPGCTLSIFPFKVTHGVPGDKSHFRQSI